MMFYFKFYTFTIINNVNRPTAKTTPKDVRTGPDLPPQPIYQNRPLQI